MSTVHKHQWHQCCHVHQFLAQLGYCEDEKIYIYIYKPKQVVFWGCFWNEQRAYFKHIVQVNDASTHENHVRHWEEQENWQTSQSKPQPPTQTQLIVHLQWRKQKCINEIEVKTSLHLYFSRIVFLFAWAYKYILYFYSILSGVQPGKPFCRMPDVERVLEKTHG